MRSDIRWWISRLRLANSSGGTATSVGPARTTPASFWPSAPSISTCTAGLGKFRYVVEQTFALLHQFKRLAVRWERRLELHDAILSLACSPICWRCLKKAGS